jgi:phage shock protein A
MEEQRVLKGQIKQVLYKMGDVMSDIDRLEVDNLQLREEANVMFYGVDDEVRQGVEEEVELDSIIKEHREEINNYEEYLESLRLPVAQMETRLDELVRRIHSLLPKRLWEERSAVPRKNYMGVFGISKFDCFRAGSYVK